MIRPGSPARAIMRTLRTGLSQPPGSDLSPLLPLAKQALAFIDRGAVDDSGTAGDASELAFLLAALLEAGDELFVRQAFGLLFRLGVEGEVLAVAHLEKMPEDQAAGILTGLGDEEKLLFVNAFFRRPRPDRPKTAAFGMTVLSDVVERTPDELLILLDLLANRHEYPALPLRNALVRGRLGMWLSKLLVMDLSAEQTRYVARVVGRLREPTLVEKMAERLGELDEISAEIICRALAETPGIDPEVAAGPLTALLESPEPSLAAAALSALARCDESRAAAGLAALFVARPERIPELAPVLAGMSLAAFGQVLRALPPQLRKIALRAVYAILAAALPQAMHSAARTAGTTQAGPPPLLEMFLADLDTRAMARPFPKKPSLPEPLAAREEQKGLWNRVKSLVATQPGDEEAERGEALRQELAQPGNELHKRQILWATLDDAAITGVTLTRCALKAVSLCRTTFMDVTCVATQFSDVNFEQARLTNVVFRGCRFANCRFSETVLDRVRFVNCELRLCAFCSATGREVALKAVDAGECDFFSAALTGLSLAQCRFRAVSLVRAVMHDLTCRGVVFSDCLFEMATFPKAVFSGVRTEGCYFAGSRFSGTTDEPDILGAMAKDAAMAVADAAAGPPLPAALADGEGLRLVAATCDTVLFSRDLRRRGLALLANNKRRLAWARCRLGAAGAAFLEMLPGLIEAGAVREETGVRPAPAARITGYHANLPALRLLAGHFGPDADAALTIPGNAIAVEAVYTIGSVGTVAQTSDSDIDVWVCLAQKDAGRPDLEAFQAKLDAISREADREHGLEVHFFRMTVKDIRDNVFGYSADEGYGSAQGCLLKEEFYRTALVVAGRKPAWWYVAPYTTDEAYAKVLTGLVRALPEIAADCLNFGCVRAIAGDEYFGASLWMIVKSLTSPFKSIIKFGLLEKYAEHQGAPALLCDRLKESLFANQGGLWRCDPYALLFREVSRHYQERGQTGAVELLRQAFLQKTGFDPCDEYVNRSGEAILDHFFPYAPPALGACPPPKRQEPGEEDGFAQAVALGDAITTYFLRAYERLKQRSQELASHGGLTERDQTMLSRRIAASFSQRVGKIMRMPFIRPGRHLFASLEIGLREQKSKDMLFMAQAEPSGSGERKGRKREIVRQDASLPRLAAWLTANELYRPGLHLQAAALPAPLTLPDVAGLLAAVYDLFPVKETFAPPLSWGLAPERVTAALLIVNLLAPREERGTLGVDILYATNWGELFHLERTTNLAALDNSPAGFLAQCLERSLAQDVRIEIFAPAKSQCLAVRRARR